MNAIRLNQFSWKRKLSENSLSIYLDEFENIIRNLLISNENEYLNVNQVGVRRNYWQGEGKRRKVALYLVMLKA